MPWSSNNGGNGGWKPGGGPWGQGPGGSGNNNRPGGGGGDNQPPDFEELIRKSQERFKNVLPGGDGTGGGEAGQNKFFFALILVGIIGLWLYNSFYRVGPEQVGVEILFGKPKDEISTSGLNFHIWPVERVEIVDALAERRVTIGATPSRGRSSEGLMLSSDQNIVDIGFSVLYRVGDPREYIFNVREPDGLVRIMAESAMREVVGQSIAEDVRTRDREEVADQVKILTQDSLDKYGAGVSIVDVKLERADPPAEVADAFEEVQRAQQDQDRFQQEAIRYKNEVLGKARGEESKVLQEAEGYRDRVIAEATGESQRFLKVLEQYQKAEDVTRARIYIETMESVLSNSDKILLEQNPDGGQGVLPYLPLPEITKRNRQ